MGNEFNKLSQVLLDCKFMPVYGTTERSGSQQRPVLLGRPFTWDTNNGISVVYDEEGRPWIKRGGINSSVFYAYGQLNTGAYVPHSNDGGAFASQVLDQMCGQVSGRDLTEVRRTAGLMLVIERLMVIGQSFESPAIGMSSPTDRSLSISERLNEMAKFYELAKRIFHAKEEAELQEALREVTLQKKV